MGTSTGAPINEAVGVLSKLDPAQITELRNEFPSIADELRIGRIGGTPSDSASFDLERAEVAARALIAVANRASLELVRIQDRMRSARRRRLGSQILTLVCSSGVLGALALNKATTAVAISVLTLLASVGTLLADFGEKLLKSGEGDVYEAFEQASNASYKARKLSEELRLAIRHNISGDELRSLVTSANQLAEQLNQWVTKMVGST